MDMAKDVAHSLSSFQKVPIRQVQVGMFIVRISRQKRQLTLTPGMVSDPRTLIHLAKMGIEEVIIDVQRSHIQPSPEKTAEHSLMKQEVSLAESESQADAPEETVGQQRERMTHLYGEAKDLQSKLMHQLKEGEHIDVAQLENMADDLVDSIFTNPDAMVYLSRIRDKDRYLMEHSLNVGMLLANFGRYLQMPREQLKELLVGGLLHDTGKIMIPDEILHKPGKLTPEEYGVMKKHVEYGVRFLEDADGITPIMRKIVAFHHERLDGQGYPRGVQGKYLDQIARMSTIVDVYDALTADRCYKKGMPSMQAFRILLQGAGTQFDANLLNQFIKCMGIYPSGSLVKMRSGKLALVMEHNIEHPRQPVVQIIYDVTSQQSLDLPPVDLSETPIDEIEITVDPRDFNVDISRYFLSQAAGIRY